MGGGFHWPKSKSPYPDEFRARTVELAGSGRTTRRFSREFGVTDTTTRSWGCQADLDTGRRSDGLTTDEKQKFARLRKGNARIRGGRVAAPDGDQERQADLRPARLSR